MLSHVFISPSLIGEISFFWQSSLLNPWLHRKNPHKVIPSTRQSREEEARRVAAGFPSFTATRTSHTHFCGYVHAVAYPHSPQNRYQAWMRTAKRLKLCYHYTGTHGPMLIERYIQFSVMHILWLINTSTVNIPMKAGACHDGMLHFFQLFCKYL